MAKAVAVVTGANRGIGREICRQLAGRGFHVLLTARRAEKGRAAAKALAEALEVRRDLPGPPQGLLVRAPGLAERLQTRRLVALAVSRELRAEGVRDLLGGDTAPDHLGGEELEQLLLLRGLEVGRVGLGRRLPDGRDAAPIPLDNLGTDLFL